VSEVLLAFLWRFESRKSVIQVLNSNHLNFKMIKWDPIGSDFNPFSLLSRRLKCSTGSPTHFIGDCNTSTVSKTVVAHLGIMFMRGMKHFAVSVRLRHLSEDEPE
jgi:hypothetical protein